MAIRSNIQGYDMDLNHKLNFSYFENILTEKKESITENIESLKKEVTALCTEDEINDQEDMAELQTDNTTDQALLKRLELELVDIDAALARIRSGKYGICENTGQQIPIARLLANPTARTIISA